MPRIVLAVITLAMSVAVVLSGRAAEPQEKKREAAIAEIRRLGGTVAIEESSPGKPVIGAGMGGSGVTNASLTCLEELVELQDLYLAFTRVNDAGLEHLKGLSKLQSLNLEGTQVMGPGLKYLRGLKQLQELNLGATRIGDRGLEHLKGLARLQRLNLAGTTITDSGLERLKGLTQLQRLNLSETKLTGQGLKHLRELARLEKLELTWTEVTDAGLEHLNGLTGLKFLNLGGNLRLSSEGVNTLQHALPKCLIISEWLRPTSMLESAHTHAFPVPERRCPIRPTAHGRRASRRQVVQAMGVW